MSVTKSIAKRLTNYSSPKSFGSKLRTKRIAPLIKMIESVSKDNGHVNIIDIGGTETYWNILPRQIFEEHNLKITIFNLLGSNLPDSHGPFNFIHADGCDLSNFKTNSFHIAHSNSVIEHVGDWRKMTDFSNEFKRVARRYFIQTPNYWFPIEPHCMTPFFHWLPKPIRLWLVSNFQLGYWRKAASIDEAVRIVESARLLNKKMFQALFEDANVLTERIFWIPKSFIAIRNEKAT